MTDSIQNLTNRPAMHVGYGESHLRGIPIFLFVAAVFAGKLSVLRFTACDGPHFLLEFRFWLTISVCIALIFARRPYPINRQSMALGGVSIVLFGWFLALAQIFGNPETRAEYVRDLIYLIAFSCTAVAIFRTKADLLALARILLVLGLAMFLLAIAGVGFQPDTNGPGWAPIGGPFTFNRIEFAAMSSALYLFATGRKYYLLFAPVFLFGTFASLSKAAFLGAIFVLCYAMFQLAVLRRFSVLLPLGLALITGTVLGVASPLLLHRFESALVPPSIVQLPNAAGSAGVETAQKPEADLSSKDTPPKRGLSTVTLDNPASNFVVIYDGSHRIQMAVKAWDLFQNFPRWGTGVGYFSMKLKNAYGPEPLVVKYPHNVSLEVLSSMGLGGFFPYAMAVLVFLVAAHRKIVEFAPATSLLGIAFFVLLTSHASGDFYDLRIFWLIIIASLAA